MQKYIRIKTTHINDTCACARVRLFLSAITVFISGNPQTKTQNSVIAAYPTYMNNTVRDRQFSSLKYAISYIHTYVYIQPKWLERDVFYNTPQLASCILSTVLCCVCVCVRCFHIDANRNKTKFHSLYTYVCYFYSARWFLLREICWYSKHSFAFRMRARIAYRKLMLKVSMKRNLQKKRREKKHETKEHTLANVYCMRSSQSTYYIHKAFRCDINKHKHMTNPSTNKQAFE